MCIVPQHYSYKNIHPDAVDLLLFVGLEKLKEVLLYSRTTQVLLFLAGCLAIGFVAPAIINVFLEFTPPNTYMAGTCHITVGLRTNCFPEVDAKNQVTF